MAFPLLAAVPASVAGADAPHPVTVVPADELAISIRYTAGADVVSANTATLRAQVTAPVAAVAADVGSRVSEGDTLVVLDDTDARLDVARARADLAAVDGEIRLAASRLERATALASDNYVSDDELEDLDARLAVLKAQRAGLAVSVRIAEEALADTEIQAPFDGIVTARDAQVGGLVRDGDPLVTVVQSSGREVQAYVDPAQIAALLAADEVTLAADGERWPLVLKRVTDVIDTSSGLQAVRLGFPESLAPIGLNGTINWRSRRQFYPVDLVQRRDGRLGLFTADGRVARFHAAPNGQEGRPVLIALPPSAKIILEGRSRLQDGDPIEIVAP